MKLRFFATLVLLIGLSTASAAAGQLVRSSEWYDNSFRKYSKRFFGPAFDWRIFKAQAMAESGLDPNAKSLVGARGLMQLMPSTYKGIQSKHPELGRIDDPDCNIAAGILHDRDLWLAWEQRADPGHQKRFMLGSYNAGLLTVQQAQAIARDRGLNERLWPSIEAAGPGVSRWKYLETVGYIAANAANMSRMQKDGRVK